MASAFTASILSLQSEDATCLTRVRQAMPITVVSELLNQLKYASKSSESYPKTGIIIGINSESEEGIVCVSAAENNKSLTAGFVAAGSYSLDPEVDLNQLKSKGKKKSSSIILHVNSDSEVVAYTVQPDGSLVDDEIEEVPASYIFKNLFVISVTGSVSLTFQNKDSVNDVLKEWEKSSSKLTFSLKDSDFILKPGGKDEVTSLYGYINDAETQALDDVSAPEKLKKQQRDKIKKKRIEGKAPLNLQMVTESTDHDVTADKGDQMHSFDQPLQIPIQLSLYVNGNLSTGELQKLVVKAIKDELSLIGQFVREKSSEDKFPHLKLYRFFPRPSAHHLIDVVYPETVPDDALVEQRKQIHLTNLLPLDRPLVTKLNKPIIGKVSPSGHLINPHEGLDSGVKSPNVKALVQGCYLYHHYMQDSYDDNGWGCAYRSLQTIASWFNLQGYISNSYPSHKDIQQALVDCGDKQANFVGTRRWIGSQEVSYVLNQLYGITSKIMFVPSGADLANKGRELILHFQTQGTPIMIGGGVLAHTILGVDMNEKTGLIKFLILDPHYTGSEDLDTIQKKSWCGWKAANFWDKNSFYNLCMPQRPIQF